MKNTVHVYARGITDDDHRVVGRTFGVTPDSSELEFELPCPDCRGERAVWLCDQLGRDEMKGFAESLRKQGYLVVFYRQRGEDAPLVVFNPLEQEKLRASSMRTLVKKGKLMSGRTLLRRLKRRQARRMVPR